VKNPQEGDALPPRSHRLLLTAALSDGADALDTWRRWSEEFDLDSVSAEGFWILPLLYRNLEKQQFQGPEKQRLAGVYKQIRLGNAVAYAQLLDLIGSLQQAGIDTIPGPITSLSLMDENGAIPITPIKLLVPADALETANHLLQSRDWEPLMPLPPARLRPFVAGVRYKHRKGGQLYLNWRPFDLDCPLDQDGSCWQGAANRQVGSTAPRLARPVDLLLMACTERSLLKLSVLMNRLAADIDWQEAESRSRELGLEHEWLALVGTSPPELIHGVPRPIVQGHVNPKARSQPDNSVPLTQLARRHWRRFQHCEKTARPPSFYRYLVSYYQYSWQTSGTRALLPAAMKKAYGRLRGAGSIR
jgi:hypothetical protein